jgi:molecular chaperone DnaK (HSP70)
LVSEEERASIEKAMNELELALSQADRPTLQSKIEALNSATQGLAENLLNSAVKEALEGKNLKEGTP